MLLGMHAQNDTDSHFTLSLCLAPLLCSTKWFIQLVVHMYSQNESKG